MFQFPLPNLDHTLQNTLSGQYTPTSMAKDQLVDSTKRRLSSCRTSSPLSWSGGPPRSESRCRSISWKIWHLPARPRSLCEEKTSPAHSLARSDPVLHAPDPTLPKLGAAPTFFTNTIILEAGLWFWDNDNGISYLGGNSIFCPLLGWE